MWLVTLRIFICSLSTLSRGAQKQKIVSLCISEDGIVFVYTKKEHAGSRLHLSRVQHTMVWVSNNRKFVWKRRQRWNLILNKIKKLALHGQHAVTLSSPEKSWHWKMYASAMVLCWGFCLTQKQRPCKKQEKIYIYFLNQFCASNDKEEDIPCWVWSGDLVPINTTLSILV